MSVVSWLSVCLGRVGPGRPGGADAREPWPAGLTVWGWLVVVVGVGNTPVMLLLPACVGSGAWWVPSRVCVGVACCRGSGVVRPGCLSRPGFPFFGGFGWVWVGWL